MSVLVTIKMSADTDQFRRVQEAEPDRLRRAADPARAGGCLHHRFGIGDGFVLVVDEWDSPESFQSFFGNPDLGQLIQDMGGSGEPDITITEATETPDQF